MWDDSEESSLNSNAPAVAKRSGSPLASSNATKKSKMRVQAIKEEHLHGPFDFLSHRPKSDSQSSLRRYLRESADQEVINIMSSPETNPREIYDVDEDDDDPVTAAKPNTPVTVQIDDTPGPEDVRQLCARLIEIFPDCPVLYL